MGGGFASCLSMLLCQEEGNQGRGGTIKHYCLLRHCTRTAFHLGKRTRTRERDLKRAYVHQDDRGDVFVSEKVTGHAHSLTPTGWLTLGDSHVSSKHQGTSSSCSSLLRKTWRISKPTVFSSNVLFGRHLLFPDSSGFLWDPTLEDLLTKQGFLFSSHGLVTKIFGSKSKATGSHFHFIACPTGYLSHLINFDVFKRIVVCLGLSQSQHFQTHKAD